MEDFQTWLMRYFEKEIAEGKTEFRLVAQPGANDISLMIHPLGKDGETIDLSLERIQSSYVSLSRK